MTMPAAHYTSRQIFAYLMGRVSESEAADLERHLAGCDRCVARARREYKGVTEPAWWTPREPASEAPEHAPELAEAAKPAHGWLPRFSPLYVPALAAALILIVACGYFLLNISRRNPDVTVASLKDGVGQVDLTRSGKVLLPGGATPPASLAASVRDLLTNTVVKQPDNIQLALAATRTDRLERGATEVAAEKPVLLSPFATAVRSTRPTFFMAACQFCRDVHLIHRRPKREARLEGFRGEGHVAHSAFYGAGTDSRRAVPVASGSHRPGAA